jgi:hypothetical protein
MLLTLRHCWGTHFSTTALATASTLAASCSAVQSEKPTRTAVFVVGERLTRAEPRAFSISLAISAGVAALASPSFFWGLVLLPSTLRALGLRTTGMGRLRVVL